MQLRGPEADTPILWPPDAKSWLIWKDPDAGKDWGQEENGTTEDEMVGWHHRLNGHGFGWTLGVGDGQGGLACCGSWDHKESDTTEWLNWTELNWNLIWINFLVNSLHILGVIPETVNISRVRLNALHKSRAEAHTFINQISTMLFWVREILLFSMKIIYWGSRGSRDL